MKLVDKYIEYLRYEKNYSLHTEISYFTDLTQFESYLMDSYPDIDLLSVDSDIIRAWLASLMKEKMTARSVNRKLSTLKSFYHYLVYKEYLVKNPASKIVGPKTKKPLPTFVPDREMDFLLDDPAEEFTENDFTALRDALILETFYMTGMRRAELIGIKDEDVDSIKGTILVTGKRNKQRIIPISDELKEKINKYIQCRDSQVSSKSEALFVRDNGMKLYPTLVYRIIVGQLKKIPTLVKASPHVLRHTFATSMLNAGADINAVKEILGHASLAATEIYTHTSFDELKHIYNQAHPRERKNNKEE